MQDFSFLCEIARQAGFVNAGIIAVEKIPFDPGFRKACEANQCGNYGKCWTCPPDVGEIDDLIRQAKQYRWAVVYQTIGQLEDSYDFEEMMEAGSRHQSNTRTFIEQTSKIWKGDFLHLSAGGCRCCARCAKLDNQPCRFPDQALASLEAYGVAVSELAPKVHMKYVNGVNTVTYFGMCLFQDAEEPGRETK